MHPRTISNVTDTETMSPHFNTETADTTVLSRKTALHLPLTEAVSRKTLLDLPLTGAVSRKTSSDFPLTELFSTDVASMFTDIATMSVTFRINGSIIVRKHFRRSTWSFYERMVLNTTNDICGDEFSRR
jgi:hypothetical protein